MATTFTPNLTLPNPTPADPSVTNAWGTLENTARTLLDTAVAGILTLSIAGNTTPVILTSNTGAPDQSRNRAFNFTGLITGNILVLWPQGLNRFFSVTNSTTGAFTVTLGVNNGTGAAAGSTFVIAQGTSLFFQSDGTNITATSNVPGGPAAGDLGGTYPNPTVVATHLSAPLPIAQGGIGVSSATRAGQVLVSSSTSAASFVAAPAHGHCFMGVSNGTTMTLNPRDGNGIKINGLYYSLPAAVNATNSSTFVNGVAAQAVAPSTIYNVYLFNNGGTLTLDFWTGANSGHITDTTAGNEGVEVRSVGGSPDSTRTLVGKTLTTGGGAFAANILGAATVGQVSTLSWFNRRPLTIQNLNVSNVATASVSLVNITNTTSTVITWGDTSVCMTGTGLMESNTNNGGGLLICAVNGSTFGTVAESEMELSGLPDTITSTGSIAPAEGTVYNFQLFGAATPGGTTVTYFGSSDTGFTVTGIWG